MKNPNYIAITLGPIISTIIEAKKSRAKWAASYFFSWFTKMIVSEAKDKYKILLPYSKNILDAENGSGLYADRIYFYADENCTKLKIEGVINKIITDIAEDISKHLNRSNINYIPFLTDYLNCHVIETNSTELSLANLPLQTINNKLDKAELWKNAPYKYEENPLQAYFELQTYNKTKLVDDAFKGKSRYNIANKIKRYFYSLTEITTTTLFRLHQGRYEAIIEKVFYDQEISIEEDIELMDAFIADESEVFKVLPHHKYYAIMYADGDNIGTLLKGLDKRDDRNEALAEFSKSLLDFGVKTDKTIEEYGGNGIYLGGEDILAFLPVACVENGNKETTQNIFSLIKKIDENFKNTVQEVAKNYKIDEPTLSYGIMIGYYKKPLKESMLIALDLLNTNAKSKPNKNAIAIRFEKHSGQFTECCIEKNKNQSYNDINKFMLDYTSTLNYNTLEIDQNCKMLNGLVHRFKDTLFEKILLQITNVENLEERINAIFENFFDEQIHKQNQFLEKVKLMCKSLFEEYENKEEGLKILYSIARIALFINSKREENG